LLSENEIYKIKFTNLDYLNFKYSNYLFINKYINFYFNLKKKNYLKYYNKIKIFITKITFYNLKEDLLPKVMGARPNILLFFSGIVKWYNSYLQKCTFNFIKNTIERNSFRFIQLRKVLILLKLRSFIKFKYYFNIGSS
jgi:hypothetical protein